MPRQFVSSMSASRDVLAMASAEFNLSEIDVGQTLTVKWRGKPVFIKHRSEDQIAAEATVNMSELRDQASQTPYGPYGAGCHTPAVSHVVAATDGFPSLSCPHRRPMTCACRTQSGSSSWPSAPTSDACPSPTQATTEAGSAPATGPTTTAPAASARALLLSTSRCFPPGAPPPCTCCESAAPLLSPPKR